MAETGDIIKSGLPVTGRAKAMQQRLTTPSGIVSSAEMPGVTPTTVSKKASKRIPPIKFDAEGDPRENLQFPEDALFAKPAPEPKIQDLPPADFSDLKPKSPIGLTGTPAQLGAERTSPQMQPLPAEMRVEKPGIREGMVRFFAGLNPFGRRKLAEAPPTAEPAPATPEVVNQAAETTTQPAPTATTMTADERARLAAETARAAINAVSKTTT